MRFTIFLISIFSFLSFKVIAQKEANHWYFGDRAGLNFNGGGPTALFNSAMSYPVDGCTAVSDNNGNLLFYSNGVTVWNRNHLPMPNGTGLMGHLSSSQSVTAIPKPGSNTIYYLFTVDAIENNLAGGLRYSIVDMNLANGFGDVTMKNILLETPVTENLTATQHANGIDYWIVTHRWNSNAYTAYQVTSAGVVSTPVVSNVGVNVSGSILNATGILKASPDGRKLGHGIRDLQLFQIADFNPNNGFITNAVASPSIYPISVGIEFSPDGSKLYASAAGNSRIYQFDLTAPNVFSTGIVIGTSSLITTHLQLGSNGKIYCSQRDSYYLGVINEPNKLGSLCNYVENGIFLGGKKSWFALPNFPTNLFRQINFTNFNFSASCEGENVSFSLPGYHSGISVNWNFGDPGSGSKNISTIGNPAHIYNSAGTYQVTLTITNGGNQIILNQTVVINEKPKVNLGEDTALCAGQTLLLGKNPETGVSYKWQDGSGNSTFLVQSSGIYSLEVTKNGCKAIDSIKVIYYTPAFVNLGPDLKKCIGETVVLGDSPIAGVTYKWQDGSNNSYYQVNKPGVYSLEVTKSGCGTSTGSVEVKFEDCSLFIPNIITPNGDGFNDAFKIRGLNLPEYDLQIFNRWGSRIYESQNYQNDWSGNGLSDGVYYYFLRHKTNGNNYKGWVEIVK